MNAEQPIVNIIGERVALGPLRTDLLPLDQQWMNDLLTQSLLGLTPQPRMLEGQRARYARLTDGPDSELFLVYERAGWRPLGTTGLHDIDERNGTAEFGIMLGVEGRGRGYGTEATRLTLNYAFTARGLRNLQLRVGACNSVALLVYETTRSAASASRTGTATDSGTRSTCKRWRATSPALSWRACTCRTTPACRAQAGARATQAA
jgi:RimJ/RimL family protein N-acetyltransferase